MVLICASAVRNGIEVIGRTSIVLTIITTIILVLTSLLSIPLMDFKFYYPFFKPLNQDSLLQFLFPPPFPLEKL